MKRPQTVLAAVAGAAVGLLVVLMLYTSSSTPPPTTRAAAATGGGAGAADVAANPGTRAAGEADMATEDSVALPPATPVPPRGFKAAYIFVATNHTHWLHCYRLAQNLRALGTRFPTLCGTLEPPSQVTAADAALARAVNMTFVHFEPFWSPSNVMPDWWNRRSQWIAAWEKLNVLRMYDYDALMLIDTDMVVMRAPDEVLYTVNDDNPLMVTFGMDNCEFPYDPNTGVYVVKPVQRLVDGLIRFVNEPCATRQTRPRECGVLFHSGDQSALGWFIKDPIGLAEVFHNRPPGALSHVYNMVVWYCNCEKFKPALFQTAIWHFTIMKPWEIDPDQADPECLKGPLRVYHQHRRTVLNLAKDISDRSNTTATVLQFPNGVLKSYPWDNRL